MTSPVPGVPDVILALMVVLFITTTSIANRPAVRTRGNPEKFLPEIVTTVPPEVGANGGAMPVTVGFVPAG
jgi:hypothetical protein